MVLFRQKPEESMYGFALDIKFGVFIGQECCGDIPVIQFAQIMNESGEQYLAGVQFRELLQKKSGQQNQAP